MVRDEERRRREETPLASSESSKKVVHFFERVSEDEKVTIRERNKPDVEKVDLPKDFYDVEELAHKKETKAILSTEDVENTPKQAENDWEEFLKMTENSIVTEEDRQEDEDRRSLEQAWYERYRLAPLLAHRDGVQLETEKGDDETPPSLFVDSDHDDLYMHIIASSKKKRKSNHLTMTNLTKDASLSKKKIKDNFPSSSPSDPNYPSEECSANAVQEEDDLLLELDWRTGEVASKNAALQ